MGKEGVTDMDTVQECKEGIGKEHPLMEAKPLPTKLCVGFGMLSWMLHNFLRDWKERYPNKNKFLADRSQVRMLRYPWSPSSSQ